MTDLKPCPFCDGPGGEMIDHLGHRWVRCRPCGLEYVRVEVWNQWTTEAEATGKQGVKFNEDAERQAFEDVIRGITDPNNHQDDLARDEYAHDDYARWPTQMAWEVWKARAAPSATVDVTASGDFDAWMANPYTKVLQKSITEDYVPKADAGVASVPDGYALVPIEPDETMIRATCSAQHIGGFKDYEEWADKTSGWMQKMLRALLIADYKTMLAAAPTPTAPDEVALEQREADYELAYKHGWINCAKWANRVDLICQIASAEYRRDVAAACRKHGFSTLDAAIAASKKGGA